jgi:trimeric autotransporter adhesin
MEVDLMGRYTILVGALLIGIYAGCSSGADSLSTGDVGHNGSIRASVEAVAEGFDPDFALPGISGELGPTIYAMAPLANQSFVVGGSFTYAGNTEAKRVAIWADKKWTPVGDGFSFDVTRLATNVATGEIYAVTNERPTSRIHRWDGTAWKEIGAFDGDVRSLELASNGVLYVAGAFTKVDGDPVQGFAKYDGSKWTTLGAPPGMLSAVRIIGNQPCVGGNIGEPGSIGVACFDGLSWISRTANMAAGTVQVLRQQSGQLIAAGRFALQDPNGNPESVGSLARWTGAKWELIGGGMAASVGPADVTDVTIDGTKIYLIGQIAMVGGSTLASNVALYDTATARWSALGGGLTGSTATNPSPTAPPGRSLTIDPSGNVYAGGSFSVASGKSTFGIARWTGSAWSSVDDDGARRFGVNGKTMAAAAGPDGTFYTGGTFAVVGADIAANNVARFKDGVWSPLGRGLDGPVWSLALSASGSELYAGGNFVSSGVVAASHVARWNGATWSALGDGLNGGVSVVRVAPDGKVYAGGDFTDSGGKPVHRIAVWDGSTWSPLGDGFADGRVATIAFGPDGKLYAGGTFKTSGTITTRGIAVWDGLTWSQVGGGVEGPSSFSITGVYDIVFFNGKLTISGQFTKEGATTGGGATDLNNVAVFNGTSWSSLGGSLPPVSPSFNTVQARSMAVHGSHLYVGGILALLGGTAADGGAARSAKHLARWDGTTWSEVGGGLSDAADEILSTADSLWVVGSFTWAGSRGSDWLARYRYAQP